jgi:predicted acyltransferase
MVANKNATTVPLTSVENPKRLLSLDFLRGFIMVLLALESARLFEGLLHVAKDSFLERILQQFFHHPWNGLYFWDVIQPGFMYIAGVALALSLLKQQSAGMEWTQSFKKIAVRCAWLFFLGVLTYAVQPEGLLLRFTNVLTQLSITLLITFFIFYWSFAAQIIMCIGLLLLTEILYRYTTIPGFDEPFTNQHNFGNYVDFLLSGMMIPDGWASINCIPTAVHTIAGSLTGKLLMSSQHKLKPIFIWGLACIILGIGLDLTGVTPVIKRIATSSFTLVSLGICLLAYVACYWWIDVRRHQKYLGFFIIVGMNSIFIYLFFEIVGARWFNDYVFALVIGLSNMLYIPFAVSTIVASLCIFMLEWRLCYFLYRKQIFLRI